MSEQKIEKWGEIKVGDDVWFVLSDGLCHSGKILEFFQEHDREMAVSIYDTTDRRHRNLLASQVSTRPLPDVKKKRHRNVKKKVERRSNKVF
jgi:hypothetical protein